MNQFDYQTYYKRRLPHYQPIGYKFFINFRLAKSLPESAIQQLRTEKERIKKILVSAKPCGRLLLRFNFQSNYFINFLSGHSETNLPQGLRTGSGWEKGG